MIHLMHYTPHAYPEATFYTDRCRDANGRTPAQNAHRYGLCAAMNGVRLGSRVLVSRSGGRGRTCRVIVTITDRIGHGSDVDLRPRAAQEVMGGRYQVIGRIKVKLHVLSQGKQRKHSNGTERTGQPL